MTDDSASLGDAWIKKQGDGGPIHEGDVVSVHVRVAASVADLDDDACHIESTHGLERSAPLVIRLDPSLLLAEVFLGMAGKRVGTTIVIPIDVTRHGLAERLPLKGTFYIEVWIIDLLRGVEVGVRTLVRRSLEFNPSPRARLRASLESAKTQRNGTVVRIHAGDFELLSELVDGIRKRRPEIPAPHTLASDGQSNRVDVLFAILSMSISFPMRSLMLDSSSALSIVGANVSSMSIIIVYHLFALQDWTQTIASLRDEAVKLSFSATPDSLERDDARRRCNELRDRYPLTQVLILGSAVAAMAVLGLVAGFLARGQVPLALSISPLAVLFAVYVTSSLVVRRSGHAVAAQALDYLA